VSFIISLNAATVTECAGGCRCCVR